MSFPGVRALAITSTMGLIACGGDPTDGPRYVAVGTVTACETLEWARTHADLLEADDPAEARQFASDRCFNVERGLPVIITDALAGGFLRGPNRWVLVASADDRPLEHVASAELRRTLGLEPRAEGWVRRSELADAP